MNSTSPVRSREPAESYEAVRAIARALRSTRLVGVVLSALLLSFSAAAQTSEVDPAPSILDPTVIPATGEPEPARMDICVRLSKELFAELTQQKVEMTVPVSRQVDGMPLTGSASGVGLTDIELTPSDTQAEVDIVLHGTAVGALRSDVGPAIVRLTTRAKFTTRKRLNFDGLRFVADPATATAQNCTTIDRVCAKRKGPVGKLVEVVGKKMADKSLPDVNSRAQDITKDMLASTFDEMAVELVDELNQFNQFDEVIAKHFPETKSWEYQMATRETFLLVGIGPQKVSFPPEILGDTKPPTALAEMWLRLTPGQAALLELMGELGVANDLLRDFVSDDDAEGLDDEVIIDRVGEWTVLRVGKLTPSVTEPKDEDPISNPPNQSK